jgi:PAS domain S-box-containing protein
MQREEVPTLSPSIVGWLLESGRTKVLAISVGLVAGVAALDGIAGAEVSLGILYVLPILPASLVLNRSQILAFGFVCAVLRGLFLTSASPLDAAFRFLLALVAYVSAGLFLSELMRNRRLALGHVAELKRQQSLRREAEEQLRLLAESSPAAILTLDERANILSANLAAKRMLGLPESADAAGRPIAECLPVLSDALKMEMRKGLFRTAAQCQGRRANGEIFVAQTWFSTYETPAGRRLAAIAVDFSEETREREEQNLRLLLDNNRIIAGAVSHEIRNVCSAIALVYSNLGRLAGIEQNEDFRAMGTLVGTLERIAAAELHSKVQPALAPLDVHEYLNHLRIIIEPAWQEIEGRVVWDVPRGLPPVLADSFGLTLAFLNLAQNSQRAVESSPTKELRISAALQSGKVVVCFEDSGPGVADPRNLFEPFQQGAEQVGLGLYVSRAILRSYGGDLRHEPSAKGCRFVAELRNVSGRSAVAA